jgi:Deoxyribonuclease NucA/NucB
MAEASGTGGNTSGGNQGGGGGASPPPSDPAPAQSSAKDSGAPDSSKDSAPPSGDSGAAKDSGPAKDSAAGGSSDKAAQSQDKGADKGTDPGSGGDKQQTAPGDQQPGTDKQTPDKQPPSGDQAAGKTDGTQQNGNTGNKSATGDEFDQRVLNDAPLPDSDTGSLRDVAKDLRITKDRGQQAIDEASRVQRDTSQNFGGKPGEQLGAKLAAQAEDTKKTGDDMNKLADDVDHAADTIDATKQERLNDMDDARPLYHLAGTMSDVESRATQDRMVADTVNRGNTATQQGVQAMDGIGNWSSDQNEPENRNPVLGMVGDHLRSEGENYVEAEKAVGETADDVIDAAGSAAGKVLDFFGATDAGDDVERGLDEAGDFVAEGTLEEGARMRNALFNLAQATDGTDKPRTVYISEERYPEAAQHINEAQGGTIWTGDKSRTDTPKDPVLTVKREGSAERREQAIGSIPTKDGFDRDEYPPAVADEGGAGSSVKYLDYRDNRGAGSAMGNQLNGRDASIRRQLDARGLLGDFWGAGRADDGDLFEMRTFR